jgi:hypothetical protein
VYGTHVSRFEFNTLHLNVQRHYPIWIVTKLITFQAFWAFSCAKVKIEPAMAISG